MLKIISLQATTSTQSRNCLKSVLSILPHPHKVENVKDQSSLKSTTSTQSRKC